MSLNEYLHLQYDRLLCDLSCYYILLYTFQREWERDNSNRERHRTQHAAGRKRERGGEEEKRRTRPHAPSIVS